MSPPSTRSTCPHWAALLISPYWNLVPSHDGHWRYNPGRWFMPVLVFQICCAVAIVLTLLRDVQWHQGPIAWITAPLYAWKVVAIVAIAKVCFTVILLRRGGDPAKRTGTAGLAFQAEIDAAFDAAFAPRSGGSGEK